MAKVRGKIIAASRTSFTRASPPKINNVIMIVFSSIFPCLSIIELVPSIHLLLHVMFVCFLFPHSFQFPWAIQWARHIRHVTGKEKIHNAGETGSLIIDVSPWSFVSVV